MTWRFGVCTSEGELVEFKDSVARDEVIAAIGSVTGEWERDLDTLFRTAVNPLRCASLLRASPTLRCESIPIGILGLCWSLLERSWTHEHD
jgi:hypothetical protein